MTALLEKLTVDESKLQMDPSYERVQDALASIRDLAYPMQLQRHSKQQGNASGSTLSSLQASALNARRKELASALRIAINRMQDMEYRMRKRE